MKLKLNASASASILTYTAENVDVSVAGCPGKYLTGINSGFNMGTNGIAMGFVRSLIGGFWGFTTSVRGLWIYKGVPPTLSEFDDYVLNAPAKITASGVMRYSDLLIKYTPLAQTIVKSSLIHTFSPSTAVASGQATWYIVGVYADNSSGVALPSHLIMGTISPSGGGGDIELPDIEIVSGVQYRVPPYELKLPSKFST